ncbi:hypothetical protein BX600DRAFT_554410 [Xylariales sp. PMI_506]|nr:hypothetical protein BX600DRAFT_554410 [Xylariales sp. PMI_506]
MATDISSYCLTQECVQAASRILSFLSPNYENIDPCEEFDQYVCGGFPSLIPDKDNYAPYDVAADSNKYLLKSIMDGSYPATSESSSDGESIFEKLQQSYLACMDVDGVSAGASYTVEIYDQITSVFPVDDADFDSNTTMTTDDYGSLAELQAYLTTVGISVLGTFDTVPRPDNPDIFVPYVNAVNLTKALSLPNVTQLATVLEEVYPIDAAKTAAPQLAQGILNLYNQLTTVFASASGVDVNMTLNDAASVASVLSINKVFSDLAPSDYEFGEVFINSPDYFSNASDILANTPKAVIQASILITAATNLARIVTIDPADPNRWVDVCFPYIDATLPWIASKFYLDAVYNESIVQYVEDVVDDLRDTFIDRLDDVTWMTNATRELAKEKARAIKKNIGYPVENPNARNATSLSLFYDDITIGPSHFNNTLSYRHWLAARTWAKLSAPTTAGAGAAASDEWPDDDHAYLVNAAYRATGNEIYFPAAILRLPFFSPSLPAYLVYGAFGSVSGHEITHGFDNSGRFFDAEGRRGLVSEQWDNETLSGFVERAGCFVEQYGNFTLTADAPVAGVPVVDPSTNETLHLDGANTLNENIADAGGVATSWAAWSRSRSRNNDSDSSSNLLLPGLDGFTPEQLFFVAFGQFFCHRDDAAGLVNDVATDVHAPGSARIRGMMQNARGFREAFSCAVKDPVCELW